MDILKHINKFNEMYAGTEPAPVRYNTQQYLQGGRVKYQGGQLVDHGPEGVRQGYGTKKSPYYTPVKNPQYQRPPGFITRTALAKLLDINPSTIMSSKSHVKLGGHGQTLYKNITDTLTVKQSSSRAPEFYSKPTKIQIDQILAGTGREGQQGKRLVYKGKETMASVVKKLLENTSKSFTPREIVEKIAGTAPVNIGNHPVKSGLDKILRDYPELRKKIKSDVGTMKRMKFAPKELEK